MALMSIVALALVPSGLAAATQDNYALVIVPPTTVPAPVVLDVDFAAVARALGMKTAGLKVGRDDVTAALEGKPLTPIPCQYDPTGAATGSLTLAVPASDASQRIRIYFGAPRPRLPRPAYPSRRVRVQQDGGAVIVDNGFARVRHDPKVQAGLPSRWEFIDTGKVFADYNNNDRVWDKSSGTGYWLRNCPQAQVKVVAAGPLRTVIRVTAYYCRSDGARPDSRPSAVYEYSYFAGSPFVLLHARVTQKRRFDWSELHIVEINFKSTDFTHWLVPGGSGELVSDKASRRGEGWVAVADGPKGPNVLAVVASRPILYDGRKHYGVYVHGPWVRWSGTEAEFDVALYAAGDPKALARLEGAAAAQLKPRRARLSTPGLERDLSALVQAGRHEGRAAWAWVAALLQRLSADDLPAAALLARDAARQAGGARAPAPWLRAARWPFVCVASDDLGLAVRRDKGQARLASLFDLKRRREILSSAQGPLWSLEAEDADGNLLAADASLPAQKCTTALDGRSIQMRWLPLRELGRPDADKLVVEVSLGVSHDSLIARMHIKNDTKLSLAEVVWPSLYFGPLGERGDDDVLVQPFGPGRLCPNPYLAAPSVKDLYPNGGWDMQMFALYDDRGGLVAMSQDPLASAKYLECRSEQGAVRIAFRWPVPDHTRPGNDFAPPGRMAVQLIDGDWYDAAMAYRAWVKKEALWWPQRGKPGRPDTPQWMRDLPLWALSSGPPDRVVPAVKAFRKYMGVPCAVHWYNWHKIPFDNDYPHYFPTKPGFAEGVRELQRAGVRVMPYINGRLWDSDTPDFLTKALPFATKDRKGNYYVEVYGSGEKLVPMCPATRLWQETVQGIVKRLVGPECNVDGVYIDQVAAARPRMCYDPGHGHPLGGGHWWTTRGYWPMLSKLQADLARQFPDKMLTTECTAEPYAHVFDGYLSWHWQEKNAVPFFPAVYADKIRLFSRAYRYRGDKALVFRMKLAQQFVFGEQMGWLDPNVWKEKEIGPYMRRLGRIRWALRAYFRGRMLRPPALSGRIDDVTGDWAWHRKTIVTMKAVQVGAWRAEDGRVAVVVTNLSRKPQKATLRLPIDEYGISPRASITWLSESGPVNRQPARLSAGAVTLTLAPGDAWGLLLEK